MKMTKEKHIDTDLMTSFSLPTTAICCCTFSKTFPLPSFSLLSLLPAGICLELFTTSETSQTFSILKTLF